LRQTFLTTRTQDLSPTEVNATTGLAELLNEISVLLVDDHDILREGIKQLLESSGRIKVVASVGTSREALTRVEGMVLDVAILDISLGLEDGVELLQAIKTLKPDLPTLMLSMYDDKATVLRALKAGADGYIGKNSSLRDLLKAITAVSNKESYLHPSLAPTVIAALRHDEKQPLCLLTQRESQILRMVAAGRNNGTIAKELFVSVSTVKANLRELFRKLGVSSRTEAVVKAMEIGYLE